LLASISAVVHGTSSVKRGLRIKGGGNELTLAGVVKEDLACPGSSLPEKRNIKRQASSSA